MIRRSRVVAVATFISFVVITISNNSFLFLFLGVAWIYEIIKLLRMIRRGRAKSTVH